MRSSGGRSRRMALTMCVTTLVAVPVAGAAAQDTAPADRPPVADYGVAIIKTTKSKQAVQAKQGSYCLPAADGVGGVCRTATFPLAGAPVITVSAREEITLLFKIPVGYVAWRTARINSRTGQEVEVANGEGERVTRTKKRWRLRLPKTMRKSTKILGLYVTYPNAFNSFEVGIKVR